MSNDNDWLFNNEVQLSPKHKHCEGFYIRCEACDNTLTTEQQLHGLCSACLPSVYRGMDNRYDVDDRYIMEHTLWANPQGSIEDEFFESKDYEGN